MPNDRHGAWREEVYRARAVYDRRRTSSDAQDQLDEFTRVARRVLATIAREQVWLVNQCRNRKPTSSTVEQLALHLNLSLTITDWMRRRGVEP
jgi:hypothetical protein